ncbi:hypothetical protein [Terrisporobacter sp.]
MTVYINPKYRIKRSALQQEMMSKLRDSKIFEDYRDILMISAITGYLNKQFIPIEKPASDGVLMQFFNNTDYDIMDLIAYAHAREQSILQKDEKYEIFSAYANGGFPLVLEVLNISEDDEINIRSRCDILTRYFSLLLTNGFELSKEDIYEELKN